MANKKEISPKYKATAHEYIKDWNLKRSMLAAGYSESYADKRGYLLLGNVGFMNYVAEIQKDIAKEAGLSVLGLLNRLKSIAYGDITDLMDGWGKLKEFKNLTDDQKAIVKKVTIKDKDTSIEASDPIRAIQEINKMLGNYEAEKHEHKVELEQIVGIQIKK